MSPKKQRQRGRSAPPPNRSRYPAPTERARIVARRDELMKELVAATFIPGEMDMRMPLLLRQYGAKEIGLIMGIIQKSTARASLIGENAQIYRNYRQTYAQFGGDRPFLGQAEHMALMTE